MTTDSADTPESRPNPASGRVAFQHADYRYYWLARTLGVFAVDLQIATLGWQLWILTKDPFVLGMIGGFSVLPFLCLFPVSGMVADRFQRKRILSACVALQTLCAISFLTLTLTDNVSVPYMLGIVFFLGLARTFQSPAQQSIVPILVPKEHFANAVAWTSAGFQVARIAGPGMSGFMIAFGGEEFAYSVALTFFIISTTLTFFIKSSTQIINKDPLNFATVFAGVRFIFRRQIILGAISIDLFAVLLGGAVALLPAVATDILGVGAEGYGVLRMTHMLGAFFAALYFTQYPIKRRAGLKLLLGVGIFGLSIVLFGVSTNFWLSIGALLLLGAADSVSVFVRNNLVQIVTPDQMRGRVSAVNSVFISASNELGELESGVTAGLWGVMPAIVVGGIGTVVVAILFARIFPQLRGVDSLDPDELVRKYQ